MRRRKACPGWVPASSTGPADESGQSWDFVVTSNSHPEMFIAGPAITSSGTLIYTLAPDANGTATLHVKLVDGGGTAHGGSDTSQELAFTITATAVNDAPEFHRGRESRG